MQKRISVLIVDDHTIVRSGIHDFLALEADIDVIAEADSGEGAVTCAVTYHPDVMLLDLIMPGMNGVEATKRVKQACPDTQIVILTSHPDHKYVLLALQAGAISYTLKNIDMEGLVDVIRKAAHGESSLNVQTTISLIQKERHVGLEDDLSRREYAVLLLVAHGHSNVQIARHLHISERTVKSHVSNLLGKLMLTDRTQLAVHAWQQGLIVGTHL